MSKKILLSVGVILVILIIGFFWMSSRNRSMSPVGTTSFTDGDLTVTVKYSRPSVRGRMIFGPEGSGALLPYDKYWRLGANEPTSIEFSQDVFFAGQPVSKGKYRMYAFPGEKEFTIVLNSEISAWGYAEPDYSKDVVKISIPAVIAESPTEQLTIEAGKSDALFVLIKWDKVSLSIPVAQ
ncbi:MAG: DUF2911 domain-containing protein [Cyclobacteriaceae bacterium]